MKCLTLIPQCWKVAEMVLFILIHPMAFHSLLTATALTGFSYFVKSQTFFSSHSHRMTAVPDFSLREIYAPPEDYSSYFGINTSSGSTTEGREILEQESQSR